MVQGRRPARTFYARSPILVAQELLGMRLCRRDADGTRWVGRIIETEAYGGRGDRASHAHRGRTPRNEVMFGPPGHAYVYFTYGMHWLLNVVCAAEGTPAAVLIRGVELVVKDSGQRAVGSRTNHPPAGCPLPTAQILNGPAKLTKALRITGALNGEDLVTSRRLWIEKALTAPARHILRTPRIGVDYAGQAARWRRRYLLLQSEIKNREV